MEFKTYKMPDSWYFLPTIQYKTSSYTSYQQETKDVGDGWIARRKIGETTRHETKALNFKFLNREFIVLFKKDTIL